MMRSIALGVILAFYLSSIDQAWGIQCWSCRNALNNEECNARGEEVTCKDDEACFNKQVSRKDGTVYEIHKGCKKTKLDVCKNQDQQGSGVYPYKCAKEKDQSLCRCCCFSDMCNGPHTECKDAPTCVKRSQPGNGKIRCPPRIAFGSKCFVTCNKGYVRRGPRIITCNNGTDQGFWSPREPISCVHDGQVQNEDQNKQNRQRVTCRPQILKLGNGTVTCENAEDYKTKGLQNYIGSKCAFRCNDNYFMSGPSLLVCNPGGQWSGNMPTCLPGICQKPPQDPNRIDDCSNDLMFGSTCTMKCKKGYKLVGSSDSTCESISRNIMQGRWTNEFPKCMRAECRPQLNKPANGKLKCSNENLVDSICTFSCEEGYDLTDTPSNALQLRCVSDGKETLWDGEVPRCESISCKRLKMPENGNVACTGDGKLGTKCSFSCNPGFDLIAAAKKTVETVCQNAFNGENEGVWSVESVTCAPIKCRPPRQNPENGFVTCSNENNVGSICIFSCNGEYDLDGTKDKTKINICEENDAGDGTGKWSATPATCSTKFACNLIQVDPSHGTVSCSDDSFKGSVCDFACEEGYELKGDSSITCLDIKNDGDSVLEWSSEAPKCAVSTCQAKWYDADEMTVNCDRPIRKDFYPVGTTCTYSCKEAGRRLEYTDADEEIGADTCMKTKTWSRKTSPRCVIKTCGRIEKIENGQQPKCTEGDSFKSKCTFACDPRYILSHTDPLVCEAGDREKDGKWDREPPTCLLNECLALPASPPKGKITCSDGTKIGSYCSLQCDMGYAAKINRIDCAKKSRMVEGEKIEVPEFTLVEDFCCAECLSDIKVVLMVDARYKLDLDGTIAVSKMFIANMAGQKNTVYFSAFTYNEDVSDDSIIDEVVLKDGKLEAIFDAMDKWEIKTEGKKSDTAIALEYANIAMFENADIDAANFIVMVADDAPNFGENEMQNLTDKGINLVVMASNNYAKVSWEKLMDDDSNVMGLDANMLMQQVFAEAFSSGCSKFGNVCV